MYYNIGGFHHALLMVVNFINVVTYDWSNKIKLHLSNLFICPQNARLLCIMKSIIGGGGGGGGRYECYLLGGELGGR